MFEFRDKLLDEIDNPLAKGIFTRMAKEAHDQGLIPYLTKDAGGQIHLRSRTPEDRVIKIASKTSALDNIIKYAKELTTKGRKHIAKKNFAIPEKEAYPIHDISHARNALARVSQHGSPEEKKKVRSAVYRKYPSLKKESAGLKETLKNINLKNKLKNMDEETVESLIEIGAASTGLAGLGGSIWHQLTKNKKESKAGLPEILGVGGLIASLGVDPLTYKKKIETRAIPYEDENIKDVIKPNQTDYEESEESIKRKALLKEIAQNTDSNIAAGKILGSGLLGALGGGALGRLKGHTLLGAGLGSVLGSQTAQALMDKTSDITLDIDKGDTLLGGKFKNKAMKVEEFGTDGIGQPTVNGKKLLAHRINKTLPEDKQKKEAKLTALERSKLKDKDFALPESRKYPIHDEKHAKLALNYVSKHGTDEEKSRVRSEVAKRYPDLDVYKTAEALWNWEIIKNSGVINITDEKDDSEKKKEELETFLPKLRKKEKDPALLSQTDQLALAR